MALPISSEPAQQFMALGAALASPLPGAVGYGGVRLVHDQQVGSSPHILVAADGGLDEVGAHHGHRVAAEDRLVEAKASLQSGGRAGQHQGRVQPEFVSQLICPLLGERRRAEH